MNNHRIFLFLAFILIFPFCASGQNTPADFYREYKREQGVRNIKLPGWLVRFGTGIAARAADDDETRMMMKLGKKVGNLRLMISEDHNPIPGSAISDFVEGIKQVGFEPLIQVREPDAQVNIIAREENNVFKELVVLISEEDEFIIVNMKTNLPMEELLEVIQYFLDEEFDEGSPAPQPEQKTVRA